MHKKFLMSIVVVVLICGLQSATVMAQDEVFISEYLERMETSKKYLLEVAQLMPEDNFTFKPTPESMTYGEHLMHIAWAMDWHSQTLMGERPARDWNTDTELKTDGKTKQQMIDKMGETFDVTIDFIKNFDPNKLDERLDYFGANRTKRQILLLLTDHITHHRAQMLVYLRLNGIKPPRYVLYQ